MSRLARRHNRRVGIDMTLLTIALVGFGFILFYFGSQVITAEDAHLAHWGSAAAGAVIGWLAARLVDRFTA